jgi:hypothetical protein
MAGVITPFELPSDIPTFITHVSTKIRHYGCRVPWAFGSSTDILQRIDAAKHLHGDRRRTFVRNFRPSRNQAVRQALDLTFVKSLSKHFEIDRRVDDEGRFGRGHYERLANSIRCLAYGGDVRRRLLEERSLF